MRLAGSQGQWWQQSARVWHPSFPFARAASRCHLRHFASQHALDQSHKLGSAKNIVGQLAPKTIPGLLVTHSRIRHNHDTISMLCVVASKGQVLYTKMPKSQLLILSNMLRNVTLERSLCSHRPAE